MKPASPMRSSSICGITTSAVAFIKCSGHLVQLHALVTHITHIVFTRKNISTAVYSVDGTEAKSKNQLMDPIGVRTGQGREFVILYDIIPRQNKLVGIQLVPRIER